MERPICNEQAQAFKEVDNLIKVADIEIPEIDLTAAVMSRITPTEQNSLHKNKTSNRKKNFSLIQDLVVAAAAAITIFWFSESQLAQINIPPYTQEVVKVSNTVGGVFQSYIGLYDLAAKSISHSIDQIGTKKGDE